MKKKTYFKPTMTVVELRQQCELLVGSGYSRTDYGEANQDVPSEEVDPNTGEWVWGNN